MQTCMYYVAKIQNDNVLVVENLENINFVMNLLNNNSTHMQYAYKYSLYSYNFFI